MTFQFDPDGNPLVARTEVHPKFVPLFDRYRYKVFWGGRGGLKTWGFARALLTIAAKHSVFVICAREFQNSIAESVHRTLESQIDRLGMRPIYDVKANGITCKPTGSEFIFEGLRHNISSIKSIEDADIVWAEEADNISKHSWDTLIPTIRKPGSEIWISFNPKLETDETWQRFVVSPPSNSYVCKVNYTDNPWLSDELKQEMLDCRARSEDDFDHIWNGNCRFALEGAIFAEEIRAAENGQRIGHVPYIVGKPVHTYWDLGKSDLTAIWFVQFNGFEHHVIDYYAACGKDIDHYTQVLQKRGYTYGDNWLPHDGFNKLLISKKTIARQVQDAGFTVRQTPRLSRATGINMARSIFPRCVFDRKKCEDGLQALRHYIYRVDEHDGTRSKEPLHNWASNGADAFRYHAIASSEGHSSDETIMNESALKQPLNLGQVPQAQGWLGS